MPWFSNTFSHRALHKAAFGLVMGLCIVWSAAHALQAKTDDTTARNTFHEWPAQWDGVPLRPLALGDVEQRFAERFPGAMTRMTDGQRQYVLRYVDTPTRMLHPAMDCYRALGYKLVRARLERDARERMWRCFRAERHGTALRVCERIEDARGGAFTDTSAWYWAAASGASHGPWQAVTVAERL